MFEVMVTLLSGVALITALCLALQIYIEEELKK